MSIFSAIKDAIFGHKTGSASASSGKQPTTGASSAARPATGARPAPGATRTSGGIPASPADAKWEREVDVEMVLESLASKNPQQLNWRTSIVDLMKLLDLDSSLANRKELARELGYTSSTDDSAAMNVWLHKRVMEELKKNGGKVPASLVA